MAVMVPGLNLGVRTSKWPWYEHADALTHKGWNNKQNRARARLACCTRASHGPVPTKQSYTSNRYVRSNPWRFQQVSLAQGPGRTPGIDQSVSRHT